MEGTQRCYRVRSPQMEGDAHRTRANTAIRGVKHAKEVAQSVVADVKALPAANHSAKQPEIGIFSAVFEGPAGRLALLRARISPRCKASRAYLNWHRCHGVFCFLKNALHRQTDGATASKRLRRTVQPDPALSTQAQSIRYLDPLHCSQWARVRLQDQPEKMAPDTLLALLLLLWAPAPPHEAVAVQPPDEENFTPNIWIK